MAKKSTYNINEDNFNAYGVLKTKTQPIINAGDNVRYADVERLPTDADGKIGKLVKVFLYGVWDGEKVEFNDKQNTVVRTTWWLEKV